MITFNDDSKSPTTKTYIIMKKFCKEEIIKNLSSEFVDKIVIFDDSEDEEIRKSFETLFKKVGDKITLYEGQIETNLESFLKLRQNEKIEYIFKGDFVEN
jgi:biotin-(acetyl-CoA carboxylase) ligase